MSKLILHFPVTSFVVKYLLKSHVQIFLNETNLCKDFDRPVFSDRI